MIVPLLCLVSLFIHRASSATYVVDPLDSQLPDIARVNQTFSWKFSERTFNSSDGVPLIYSSTDLPGWLSFDPATRTFSGTPGPNDEGNPRVTVMATDGKDSTASSGVTLHVTHLPPPVLSIPIADQFRPGNRAIASAFVISSGSALATSGPGLRVPSGPWSFSIGFEWRTFTTESEVYYAVRLADGSEPPDWMWFVPDDITLDGRVPPDVGRSGPETFALVLIASDQEGYSAERVPFFVTVADHELSANAQDLPTVNVTAGSSFTTSLLSAADLTGFLIDNSPVQPSDISRLLIDTTAYDWLRYDSSTRTLSGSPPSSLSDSRVTIPATLTASFNQTLQTTIGVQLVPSYFTISEFPALHLSPGGSFSFNLRQFYSNSSAGQRGDADISLAYDTTLVGDFARFDSSTDSISGSIPFDFGADHLTITLTAYSQITHSTSHANLIVFVNNAPQGRNNGAADPRLAAEAHHRLALAIGITFGAIGGLCALAGFFAWFRRAVRVPDTALIGDEARAAWTKKERRYYGLDVVGSEKSMESILPQGNYMLRPPALNPTERTHSGSSFGHDLERVAERSFASESDSGIISRQEFMSKVKTAVRQVSGKYADVKTRAKSSPRPVIGRPILLRPSAIVNPAAMSEVPIERSPSNPFSDMYSQRASTFMTGSPSSSTAEHSIPRRRADFAPPRSMAQVHFEDGHLVRQPSTMSMASDRRSGRSGSHFSQESYPDIPGVPPVRPRLVPFTSSTRVPVPRVSSLVADASPSTNVRMTSQRAKVIKPAEEMRKSVSGDELSMGIRYVEALGGERPPSEVIPKRAQEVTRYVVRTGEKFHIRLQIPPTSQELRFMQVSGKEIPKFLKVETNGAKGMVEFTGTALSRDLGMLTVGIYAEKECISKVILEVIPRR